MKSIFATMLLIAGTSTNVWAKAIPVDDESEAHVAMPMPPAKQPEVECSYTVDSLAKSGATIEIKHGETLKVSTVQQKTSSVSGVVLKASLRQNCAMNVPGMGGGAPCFNSYKLHVSLERGIDSANLGIDLTGADIGKRFSVSLYKTGKQNAFAICEVK